MPFSESVKNEAFIRAGGRCECKKVSHDHSSGRCLAKLTRDTAVFHHMLSESNGGQNNLSNCKVLCLDCFKIIHCSSVNAVSFVNTRCDIYTF